MNRQKFEQVLAYAVGLLTFLVGSVLFRLLFEHLRG
jgi:hypothetical protein